MANSPLPAVLLPDPPRYAVQTTDEDYVILVVVPFNEGTVEEADRLSAARTAGLLADVEDRIAAFGAKADQSDLVGLAQDTLTAVNGKLDNTIAALLVLLDTLPVLPADLSTIPNGGLFRDGDANGYRLVRIFPAS